MLFSLIHERDIVDQLGALVGSASVPANIVNWGGEDPVRMQDWCQLMGDLLGTEPIFEKSDRGPRGAPLDCTKRLAITGPTSVSWREGFEELVAEWQARRP
jgi:hypothetical protein